MGTGEFNGGGNPAMDWHPIQGGVDIFIVASCHGNRDKLRPDEPLGSYVDFTYLPQANGRWLLNTGLSGTCMRLSRNINSFKYKHALRQQGTI